jgi:hypothetical protein
MPLACIARTIAKTHPVSPDLDSDSVTRPSSFIVAGRIGQSNTDVTFGLMGVAEMSRPCRTCRFVPNGFPLARRALSFATMMVDARCDEGR